ncbi:DUF805 domain-containing protein [Streptomyces sp. SID8379]|uniref:DUF805 domain-containing protein n=1 Tax=unclassified Streptomyces TaxID=2593676 RepID=UPI00037C2750|nr:MULTISPECIES: DUF805 domain-containing protein [unclassified Streptomyces]MYW66512.1 DUF805 domain-containing protein [Streptomyces sp. SID8379]
MTWYIKALRNYFGFRGRASRKEYWMYMLFNLVILYALWGLGTALDQPLYCFTYALAVTIPTVAVGVRRLHDAGHSGWFMLLVLVPLAGIALIVLLAKESKSEINTYAPGSQATWSPPPPAGS